jgi:hypothetical protein
MNPLAVFNRILERQTWFEWGDIYIPSTLAVPKEAPKGSRVSRLNSHRLGRAVHALSTPERVFTQLALYCPNLIDLHEQKMLSPTPSIHPLQGHPSTKGIHLASVKGTMAIATELGFKHYEIGVNLSDDSRVMLPFPYQGDLLLYLKGNDGFPYAVNWTIKDKKKAFWERRLGNAKTPVQQKKDRVHAQLRAELEKAYYASAGIRTVQMALDELPETVIANLDLLFMTHGLPLTLCPTLIEDFENDVQEAVNQDKPVGFLAISYAKKWGSLDQFNAKIYQDIWNRKISVNFFEPILIDRALSMGGGDLLSAYGEFFQEVAQ